MHPNKAKACLNAATAEAVAARGGHAGSSADFTRKRKLPPETMIKLLLSMDGGSLNKELYEAGISVTPSSFVGRRHQLSWFDFENVLNNFNSHCDGEDTKTYKGYRILAVDGTTVNMPLDPKSPCYMENKADKSKSYCAMHATPIFDVLNKTYLHCVVQPQPEQDEIGALLFMLSWHDFPKKTLIVADRGFESQNLIAHFIEDSNFRFLIRVKQNKSAMREIQKLPMTELDTRISYYITTTQKNIDKENNYVFIQTHKNKGRRSYSPKTKASRWDFGSPYHMQYRAVRFMLPSGEFETLVTNLPDSFTLEDMKELYAARWGIEQIFRSTKYDNNLVLLHGKNAEFCRQEIFAALIMSNFCSRIINEVIIQKKDTKYLYAVNRKMAIHLCKKFFRTEGADGEQLLQDIAKYVEPVRPGRADERKLKAKSFVPFVYRVSA